MLHQYRAPVPSLAAYRSMGAKTLKTHATKEPANAEFTNFARTLKKLVAVPKKEVEIEEARWRADRLKKKSAT
jgi:hypothetical protein